MAKKRTRRTQKFQRAVVGASLTVSFFLFRVILAYLNYLSTNVSVAYIRDATGNNCFKQINYEVLNGVSGST